jgi:threonine dehydratase
MEDHDATPADCVVSAQDVRDAADRIRGSVERTPCRRSALLSNLCDCEVYSKLDYLQPTGSFKERGARNTLEQLDQAGRDAGVIAASAGNHAQALARHGGLLGISVTVVMPKWAPLVKVAACRRLGAEVVLHGDAFDAAREQAMSIARSKGLTYVHGFNDPGVIAGAGTVAVEVLDDVPELDAVVIPVGGGGLLAGMACYIKAVKPDCRVLAVESEAAPTLTAALTAGEPVTVETRPSIADGLAIARLGDNCFEPCRRWVDRAVTVSEPDAARAVLQLLEMEKATVEGAAATPLAALTGPLADEVRGKRVAIVLCGGNIDAQVLGRVIERGLAADGRLCRVVIRVSDRAGSLAKVLELIGGAGASVREVLHDRSFGSRDVGRVDITLVLETNDADHVAFVHTALRDAGVSFRVPDPEPDTDS